MKMPEEAKLLKPLNTYLRRHLNTSFKYFFRKGRKFVLKRDLDVEYLGEIYKMNRNFDKWQSTTITKGSAISIEEYYGPIWNPPGYTNDLLIKILGPGIKLSIKCNFEDLVKAVKR